MPLDARDRGSSCGENARWPSDPCGQPCGECSGRDRAFRVDCRVDSLSGEASHSQGGFGIWPPSRERSVRETSGASRISSWVAFGVPKSKRHESFP